MEAHQNQPALPMRAHTILGVSEAIGEDFGFNPTFLVVLASRLIFPQRKSAVAVEQAPVSTAANEAGHSDLPLAA